MCSRHPASPAHIDPEPLAASQNVSAAPSESAVVQKISSDAVPRPITTCTAAPM